MITRYTCANGVRIVLEPMSTVRSVAIGVWIGTGSRHESAQNNGISHFLEHMFFKGTEKHTAREIAEAFDSIGGQVNAFTSKEYTCYYAKVLDDHASFALDMLADMFFHSAFVKEELEKERNVVCEEIKMYEDTPDDLVHDLLGRASYGEHPLGYSILGTEQTLSTFESDTLRNYVNSSYTPDCVVISVAGNIDDTFIQQIEKYFGTYQGTSTGKETTVPVFHTNKIAKQKETEQAHLCLGFEGLPIGHDDTYSLIVLNNILGGSMSSRLFQEVREQRGLAYSIYSYHSSFLDGGTLAIYGGTGNQQLDVLFETIQQTLKQLKNEGITKKELHNCKEQLKGSLMLSLESTNSRMSRNGKNELLLRKHRTLDEIVESVNAVTKEKVDGLARQIFKEDYAAALISPTGELPTGLR